MTTADDPTGSTPSQPDRRPEDLLGRRVRFRSQLGRVEEVHALRAPHVVILTRDGQMLRVPAPEWGEIELLG